MKSVADTSLKSLLQNTAHKCHIICKILLLHRVIIRAFCVYESEMYSCNKKEKNVRAASCILLTSHHYQQNRIFRKQKSTRFKNENGKSFLT